MKLPKSLVILLALSLAGSVVLAGCLDGTDEPEPDQDPEEETQEETPTEQESGSTGPDSGGNETTESEGNGNDTAPEPEPKDPPTANIVVMETEGFTPLTVKFILTGTVDSGYDLSWSFDPGDGSETVEGTELETEYEHTYTTGGTFDVVLEVSDGEETTKDNVTIEAFVPDHIVEIHDDPFPLFIHNETNTFIDAGDIVQWQNLGGLGHTVRYMEYIGEGEVDEFDSGNIPIGGIFTMEFTEPGVYLYDCEAHSPGQYGILVVQ